MDEQKLRTELQLVEAAAKEWATFRPIGRRGGDGKQRPEHPWRSAGGLAEVLKEIPLPHNRIFGRHNLFVGEWMFGWAVIEKLGRTDVETTMAWLHKILSTDVADIRIVQEIIGLGVKRPIKLSEKVMLYPRQKLPRSRRLDEVRAASDVGFKMEMELSRAFPTYAISEVAGVKRSDSHDKSAKFATALEQAEAAILAITLVGENAPLITTTWFEFIDPDLEAVLSGRSWQIQVEDGLPLPYVHDDLNIRDIRIVNEFSKLPRGLANKLTIAVSRLNLARRRRQQANRAIEVAIALESIFGDEGNKTELSYRIKNRAALFLGRSAEHKRGIKDDIGKLYDLRSKAVHGAIHGRHAEDQAALVDRGIQICAEALRKIVRNKAKPDWPNLELGIR